MIIITIETICEPFSISITRSKNIIYKEVYGDNITSDNILIFINHIISKHRIKQKHINSIILGYNLNTKKNSAKIIFSVIQTFSTILSIPIFIVNSIKSYICSQFTNCTHNKYFLLNSDINAIDIYLVLQEKLILFLQKKSIKKIYFLEDKFFPHLKQEKNIIFKSFYLDIFFKKKLTFIKYILPNSSLIPYIKEIKYTKYF